MYYLCNGFKNRIVNKHNPKTQQRMKRNILLLAMFIGRIGPLTFFLLLSENGKKKEPGLPDIDLPLG